MAETDREIAHDAGCLQRRILFGNAMKRKRLEAGLTQRELSLVLGCETSTISRMERGETRKLNPTAMMALMAFSGGVST